MDNEKAVKIGEVNTIPTHDPYHEGQCVPTTIYIVVDPSEEFVSVGEAMDTGAVSLDEWHLRVLTYGLDQSTEYDDRPHTPDAEPLAEFLRSDRAQSLLRRCVDNYVIDWNGSNHVGKHTDESEAAITELLNEINQLPSTRYNLYTVGDYLQFVIDDVSAETSDEELAKLAEEWEPGDDEILDEDVLEYLERHRESLREE